MLKQIVNGILNALIATVISLYFVKYVDKSKNINLGNLLFTIITTLVVFAIYVPGNIMTNKTFTDTKNKLLIDFKRDARAFNHELDDYVEKNIQELKNIDKLEGNSFLIYAYQVTPTQDPTLIFTTLDINKTAKPMSLVCRKEPTIYIDHNTLQLNLLNKDRCLVGGVSIDKFKTFLNTVALLSSTDAMILKNDEILLTLYKTFKNNEHLGIKKKLEKNIYHLFPNEKMPKNKSNGPILI